VQPVVSLDGSGLVDRPRRQPRGDVVSAATGPNRPPGGPSRTAAWRAVLGRV